MGLGSRYCIAPGYRHRTAEAYFDDTPLTDEWQKEVYAYAAEVLKPQGVKTVYDVGCGSGFKLIEYFHDCSTIGFDVEPTVSFLRSRYPERDWRVCDFHVDGLAKADLVICADVVEHLLDPDALMRCIGRIASRHIVLSTPDRDLVYKPDSEHRMGPPANTAHVREWNFAEFETFVSRHFKVLAHQITNREQFTQMIVCTP